MLLRGGAKVPFERNVNNKFVLESVYRFIAYLMLSFGVLLYYFPMPLQFQHYVVSIFSATVFVAILCIFALAKHKFTRHQTPLIDETTSVLNRHSFQYRVFPENLRYHISNTYIRLPWSRNLSESSARDTASLKYCG